MNVMRMKKKDFDSVPARKGFSDPVVPFWSLVIIPEKYLHDSGYRCMSFVAVDKKGGPIIRLSGCSDVLEIDGIGGCGNWRAGGEIPKTRPIQDWSIDCLPCGYLRIFCKGMITCGADLSGFEIFWNPLPKED